MRYRRRGGNALSGLDLTVEKGEIFGYLGPNGAGKTTTLKILAGLLTQTSGTAKIFGCDVANCEVRNCIGFLPEDPNFYEYLTARETLRFVADLFSMRRSAIKKRIEECLDSVGLAYAADTVVGDFSRGMRQRLGLAQALLNDPDLLLLDEPLSGLDPVGRAQIRDVILEQAEKGKTVLFSSHVLPDVEAICSRVGILGDGRVVESGTIEEMLSGSLETVELVLAELSPRVVGAVESMAKTLRKMRDRYVATTTNSQTASEIMKLVISEGGTVESVTPHRETLEDFFVRRILKGKA
jgi:ABC-2 type transport system ATP-binding protein